MSSCNGEALRREEGGITALGCGMSAFAMNIPFDCPRDVPELFAVREYGKYMRMLRLLVQVFDHK